MESPPKSPPRRRGTRKPLKSRPSLLRISPTPSSGSDRSPSPMTRLKHRRSTASESGSPAAATPVVVTPGSASSWLSQNLRGEGHMDEIIGKDADDDTIFGKKSANKRSRKGSDSFFSIAMAKVATLHWLNATGKEDITNSAMDVVPQEMKDEVARWWKVLKRRKGVASMDYKITLQHLLEVWEAAGCRRLSAAQREVIMKKFRTKDETKAITPKQFQSFCVDQMQLGQRIANMSKSNQLTNEELTLMDLMPVKDVFMSLKRHDVLMDVFQGKYSSIGEGWQVDESLFQTKMQPIATMMEADKKRAVALFGITSWKNKIAKRKEEEEARLKEHSRGAANALRMGSPMTTVEEELKASSWGAERSITDAMNDEMTAIEIAMSRVPQDDSEPSPQGQNQRRYRYITRNSVPPKDEYKLSVLRHESASAAPSAEKRHALSSPESSFEWTPHKSSSLKSSLMTMVVRNKTRSAMRQEPLRRHRERMQMRSAVGKQPSLHREGSSDFPSRQTADRDSGRGREWRSDRGQTADKLKREHRQAVQHTASSPLVSLDSLRGGQAKSMGRREITQSAAKNLTRNAGTLRTELHGNGQSDIARTSSPGLGVESGVRPIADGANPSPWSTASAQRQVEACKASSSNIRRRAPSTSRRSQVSKGPNGWETLGEMLGDEDGIADDEAAGDSDHSPDGPMTDDEPSWLLWASKHKPELLDQPLRQVDPQPEKATMRPGTAPALGISDSIGIDANNAATYSHTGGLNLSQWGFAGGNVPSRSVPGLAGYAPPQSAPAGAIRDGTLRAHQDMRNSIDRHMVTSTFLTESVEWRENFVPGPSVPRPVSAAEERGILAIARDVKSAREAKTRVPRPDVAPAMKDAYKDQRFSRPKSMQALSNKTGWHVANNECTGRHTMYFRPPPRRVIHHDEQ